MGVEETSESLEKKKSHRERHSGTNLLKHFKFYSFSFLIKAEKQKRRKAKKMLRILYWKNNQISNVILKHSLLTQLLELNEDFVESRIYKRKNTIYLS